MRVSNIARYTDAFIPVDDDLSTDVNTLLLYNFNEALGNTLVTDLSGNGYHEILGTGFSGATLPAFESPVPVPAAILLLGSGLLGLAGFSRRKNR